MTPTKEGSFHLFTFKGIEVFVHWSWLLVAFLEVEQRKGRYGSISWNVAEYLAVFAIVLLHEFGHSFASRQVGGRADQIVLWPLGGVAYAKPPPRPGAVLWTIVAGPLVNVVLFFILSWLVFYSPVLGMLEADAGRFLKDLWMINTIMLVFNLLPIYPLDGGQILQSLLWYVVGRARSLLIASSIGFLGVAGLVWLAFDWKNPWIGIMAFFVFMNCRNGFKAAKVMAAIERAPRRTDYACPSCQAAPIEGAHWQCGQCATAYDPFSTYGVCPGCGVRSAETPCFFCGERHPLPAFRKDSPTIDV